MKIQLERRANMAERRIRQTYCAEILHQSKCFAKKENC